MTLAYDALLMLLFSQIINVANDAEKVGTYLIERWEKRPIKFCFTFTSRVRITGSFFAGGFCEFTYEHFMQNEQISNYGSRESSRQTRMARRKAAENKEAKEKFSLGLSA